MAEAGYLAGMASLNFYKRKSNSEFYSNLDCNNDNPQHWGNGREFANLLRQVALSCSSFICSLNNSVL